MPLPSLGDFWWTLFPYEDEPDLPGPVRHAAFVVGAFGRKQAAGLSRAPVPTHGLVVGVYTTSQIERYEGATPVGVVRVGIGAARAGGHRKAFLVDVRKRAFMPYDSRFFPDIDRPGGGLIGPAKEDVLKRILAEFRKVNERHPELVSNLGPFRP